MLIPSLLDLRMPLYLMRARCCETFAFGTPRMSTSSLTVFSPPLRAFRISIRFGLARVLQMSDCISKSVLSFLMPLILLDCTDEVKHRVVSCVPFALPLHKTTSLHEGRHWEMPCIAITQNADDQHSVRNAGYHSRCIDQKSAFSESHRLY